MAEEEFDSNSNSASAKRRIDQIEILDNDDNSRKLRKTLEEETVVAVEDGTTFNSPVEKEQNRESTITDENGWIINDNNNPNDVETTNEIDTPTITIPATQQVTSLSIREDDVAAEDQNGDAATRIEQESVRTPEDDTTKNPNTIASTEQEVVEEAVISDNRKSLPIEDIEDISQQTQFSSTNHVAEDAWKDADFLAFDSHKNKYPDESVYSNQAVETADGDGMVPTDGDGMAPTDGINDDAILQMIPKKKWSSNVSTTTTMDDSLLGNTATISPAAVTQTTATTATTATATTKTSSIKPSPNKIVFTNRNQPTTTNPTVNHPAVGTATTITATVPSDDDFIEEMEELLPEYVGRVIGKGGEMIRDLQARSGCKIDVDQNVAAGAPRVLAYKGKRSKVLFAKQLIHLLSVQNVSEENLPLGEAVELVLAVPATVVGKVIGRGGEMIRELQAKSHAKIQVDHSNRSGMAPDQKRVSITGNKDAVVKAKEMILFLTSNPLMEAQLALNMLISEKTRTGGHWGSGPPYLNLPNQGINMQPYGTTPAVTPVPLPVAAPPGFGVNTSFAHVGNNNNNAVYPPTTAVATNPHHAMYPPQQQHQFYNPGHEMIYVQKQYMGRIIGSKGVTINDLQRRSNCTIQINQNVPPGQDCEVTISGNPQGVETAKQMIQEIIQSGPSHPYAGGMSTPTQQIMQQQQPAYGAYLGGSGGGGMYPYGGGGGMPQPVMQPHHYVPPQQQIYGSGYEQRQQNHHQQQQQQQPHGYNTGAAVYNATPYPGYVQPPQQQPTATYGYAAPSIPAATPSLWNAAKAPDGQVYYYNSQTGQTQWEKPPGMP